MLSSAPRRLRRGASLCALALAAIVATGGGTGVAQAAGGGGNGLASNQCAVLMGWFQSVKIPNGGNPYAAYSGFQFESSAKRSLEDTVIVFSQDFPYAANGGYQLYSELYRLATDGVNWPNMIPDDGSTNPYVPGNPVFAPKRHYTLAIASSDIAQSDLPGKLADIKNRISWPAGDDNWNMLQRSYNAKSGYDRGGTGGPTDTDWVNVRTYDVHTGDPVPCADIQPTRDIAQRITPWNTKGADGLTDLPTLLRPVLPQIGENTSQPPKPNKDLVEFFRLPQDGTGGPGSVVPTPADNCANYITANLDQRRIALFRVPKVPSFQPKNLPQGALYQQTDTQAYSFTVYGQFRQSFNPGTPFTYSIGNEDIRTDASGGATFVVWPRNLNIIERNIVFRFARARGWNLLEGNAESPGRYASSVWLRVNGPSSTYTGATYPNANRTGVPCMNGPQDVLPSPLVAQPFPSPFGLLGDEWAATPAFMGTATPQGVQCRTLEFVTNRCQRRLERHMKDTGGSYFVQN